MESRTANANEQIASNLLLSFRHGFVFVEIYWSPIGQFVVNFCHSLWR